MAIDFVVQLYTILPSQRAAAGVFMERCTILKVKALICNSLVTVILKNALVVKQLRLKLKMTYKNFRLG